MCGIAGYYGQGNDELLVKFNNQLSHRGPDQSGYLSGRNWGLSHTRLSIVDLSEKGKQPYISQNKKIILSFNGEIYNYKEIRKYLETKGYIFRSNSDTEVLANAIEYLGEECYKIINGIFAFAYYDNANNSINLVRDPIGVKPLYYLKQIDNIYFSSEIKPLFNLVEKELNMSSLGNYFHYLWNFNEETNFKKIKKLHPGNHLKFDKLNFKINSWFKISELIETDGEFIPNYSNFNEAIFDVTKRQFQGDVKIGAFASGGLDSTGIITALNENELSIDSLYNVYYNKKEVEMEGFPDDRLYYELLRDSTNIKGYDIEFENTDLKLLSEIAGINEELDADLSAISTYKVCELARNNGCKVLLSGTGGDETLLGYRSHLAFYWRSLFSNTINNRISNFLSFSSKYTKSFNVVNRRINKLYKIFNSDFLDAHIRSQEWNNQEFVAEIYLGDKTINNNYFEKVLTDAENLDQVRKHSWLLMQSFLSSHNFLYGDKVSMHFGIEQRVPLVDLGLIKYAFNQPLKSNIKFNNTKIELKNWLKRRYGKKFVYRPKNGFAPPVRSMLTNSCSDYIKEILLDDSCKRRGLLNVPKLSKILINPEQYGDVSYLIISALVLELWCRKFNV